MSNLEQLRKEYESHGIADGELDTDPFRQFKRWFDEATSRCTAEWFEPNAMSLSTADTRGRVTSRTVLLKHFDERGFTFFTNYDSEKAAQIAANPQVCLLFHWPFQGRQVRIDGSASRTSREISDSYFHSRPRGAQIGACISHQSQVAPAREELERQYAALAERLRDKPVPAPEHWGGFLVTPLRFEFWQGRVDRLHDRFRYQLQPSGQWQLDRLYP
jgi:pyridoxamine 5'-phosphate oxidase